MKTNSFMVILPAIMLLVVLLAIELYADENDLIWSTFIGGASEDKGRGVAVDEANNVFVVGFTSSNDFPTTAGAYSTSYNDGSYDVFVSKLNSVGDTVYSTYLGGNDQEWGMAVVTDDVGFAYIIGTTESNNFPVTPGAYDTIYSSGGSGRECFITKLNPTGDELVFSTYLGGDSDDEGYGIALDDSYNIFVVGSTKSNDFYTTGGAYDDSLNGIIDAFVTELSASGSTAVYSTYLGGNSYDYGHDIAIDNSGQPYVTGRTHSIDFPITFDTYDDSLDGDSDIFVTKINLADTNLTYSTYLGGSSTEGELHWTEIAVDSEGNAYVTGQTSSDNFPSTTEAYDDSLTGSNDGFVVKFNSTGSNLHYATYLGGSYTDYCRAIAVDIDGFAYITGETWSDDFPTTPDAIDDSTSGGSDVFVVKLNQAGSDLCYSTYLGGSANESGYDIAVNDYNTIYLTGETNSSDFPTTFGVFDTTFNGNWDCFAIKIDLNHPPLATVFRPNGGESIGYRIVNPDTIKWNATDPDPGDSSLLVIDIDYSADAGISWSIIDTNQGNDGTYLWDISRLPSTTNYLIRITATDTSDLSSSDTSDAVFTVDNPDPRIYSIWDVPNDQGRQVSILWERSYYDVPDTQLITYYSIWRKYPQGSKIETLGEEWSGTYPKDFNQIVYRRTERLDASGESKTDFWELIGTVDAHYLEGYAYIAPTLEDSSASSIPYFTFFVSGHTADPFVFWDSAPDSGYSVDNINPAKTQVGILASGTAMGSVNTIWLAWGQVTTGVDGTPEHGPIQYRIYCDEVPDFTPALLNLLTTTSDLSYSHTDTRIGDAVANLFYLITAIDGSDNESAISNVVGEFDRILINSK
jgi:hypothetical protein